MAEVGRRLSNLNLNLNQAAAGDGQGDDDPRNPKRYGDLSKSHYAKDNSRHERRNDQIMIEDKAAGAAHPQLMSGRTAKFYANTAAKKPTFENARAICPRCWGEHLDHSYLDWLHCGRKCATCGHSSATVAPVADRHIGLRCPMASFDDWRAWNGTRGLIDRQVDQVYDQVPVTGRLFVHSEPPVAARKSSSLALSQPESIRDLESHRDRSAVNRPARVTFSRSQAGNRPSSSGPLPPSWENGPQGVAGLRDYLVHEEYLEGLRKKANYIDAVKAVNRENVQSTIAAMESAKNAKAKSRTLGQQLEDTANTLLEVSSQLQEVRRRNIQLTTELASARRTHDAYERELAQLRTALTNSADENHVLRTHIRDNGMELPPSAADDGMADTPATHPQLSLADASRPRERQQGIPEPEAKPVSPEPRIKEEDEW